MKTISVMTRVNVSKTPPESGGLTRKTCLTDTNPDLEQTNIINNNNFSPRGSGDRGNDKT